MHCAKRCTWEDFNRRFCSWWPALVQYICYVNHTVSAIGAITSSSQEKVNRVAGLRESSAEIAPSLPGKILRLSPKFFNNELLSPKKSFVHDIIHNSQATLYKTVGCNESSTTSHPYISCGDTGYFSKDLLLLLAQLKYVFVAIPQIRLFRMCLDSENTISGKHLDNCYCCYRYCHNSGYIEWVPNADQQQSVVHFLTEFSADGEEIECRICYCDVSQAEALTMDCGHTFCNDCWKQHISIAIKEGGSRNIKCMQEKCGIVCQEDKVRLFFLAFAPLD